MTDKSRFHSRSVRFRSVFCLNVLRKHVLRKRIRAIAFSICITLATGTIQHIYSHYQISCNNCSFYIFFVNTAILCIGNILIILFTCYIISDSVMKNYIDTESEVVAAIAKIIKYVLQNKHKNQGMELVSIGALTGLWSDTMDRETFGAF